MPYTPDNPPERIKGLPKEAQRIWISAFNSALSQYKGDEEKSNKVAWGAVKNKFKQVEGEWVKYELPETKDIYGVEIFSNEYMPNGHEYSSEDLEEIVNGFHFTKNELKPYLKLGHDDNQKLAQNSGLPALGWVENLRKVGNKLIADFIKIPKKVYDLLLVGAYRRVSSEIYWDIEVKGKKYKYLLKAVSLLGGDTPACENLNDIISLYRESGEFAIVYKKENEVKEYQFEIIDKTKIKEKKEGFKMDEKEALKIKTENEQLKAESKKYQEELKIAEEKKKKAYEEKEKISKELSEKKELEKKAEVESLTKKLIEEKHLLPANEEKFKTLLFSLKEGEVKKYKIKGEEEKTSESILLEILRSNDVKLNINEKSEIGDNMSKEDNSVLHEKALAYAEKHKVSYSSALIEVSP